MRLHSAAHQHEFGCFLMPGKAVTEYQSGHNQSRCSLSLGARVSVLTSGWNFFLNLTKRQPQCPSLPRHLANRYVYENMGLKGEHHIYENVGELRDATPDLILAVKPKVPLEGEQVMD